MTKNNKGLLPKRLALKGSAMTEYAIVLSVLSMVFYLVIIQGLPATNSSAGAPALTQVLATHERQFINTLALP